MLKDLRELYGLLNRKQRKRLARLQVLIIVMAIAEIASVLSIGPFMAVVGDMSRLEGEGRLAWVYQASGLPSPEAFLTLLGIMVLAILLLAALFAMYTTWRLSLYSAQVGAELSSRLYRYYLHQPWLFHSGVNTSRLISKVSQEVQRTTTKIINPCMQLNAKLVMVSLMTVGILVYNPVVAVCGALIFTAAYLLLYKTVRRFLIANGRRVSKAQAKRFKLMTEGFGGIKDLLFLHRQESFTSRFDKASNSVARGMGVTQGLSDAPRYAIELVAFASVILLVLYLLNLYEGNLGAILPALSIYALAGFKMLPAFQRIYSAISHIRGNLAAYEAIREDLLASQAAELADAVPADEQVTPLVPERTIVLQDVVFDYPGKKELALDGLTLTIPANRMVGLVGASGSGKSTAVDLLLGLIRPQQGQVLIDDVPLTQENLHCWQAGVGFVPQQIFLADASVLENVAFGIERDRIDEERVREALRMAQLDDLIDKLPHGIEERIGERGVQLSGGQRQRIGIARALYQQARVLVLDEATSALDGITERRVMDDIQRLAGNMTIVLIAHRLTTVKDCDIIYMIEAGQVTDSGTYQELAERNITFQLMANL
ncbi:ABC transporter ATP-binding protein [Halomonas sp. M4R5S39]|uniref:ABC transporter ATP-binding protein n=1 Tax=Halomonas kalidii TaxID=3043293 RepID=UPI0024A85C7D|nr:ABC transporter ATP-binding protein [Halomonas kalidii]MDI5985638.1 ABC transporter ATP-binding protein [Halomonas kalidii]